MGVESRSQNDPPLSGHGFGLAIVNHFWSQQTNPAVAMFAVIPRKEILAKGAPILDGAEAVRKTRAILQGLNPHFSPGIVARRRRRAWNQGARREDAAGVLVHLRGAASPQMPARRRAPEGCRLQYSNFLCILLNRIESLEAGSRL